MTRDELLKILDDEITPYGFNPYAKALRAVVKLHKPMKIDFGLNKNCCVECSKLRGNIWTSYPCPTIQAIEKELK